MTAPPDTGAQPERTALAWRRTALAVVAGSVIGARLSMPVLGATSVVVGTLGAALAVGVWWTAARRYREARRSLAEEGSHATTTGAPMAVVAAATAAVGVLAMFFVLRQL
jgi:putative membrane protein